MWKCPPLFPRLHQPSAINNYWQVVLVYAILPRLAVPRSVVHRLTGRGYSYIIEDKSVESCPISKASNTAKIVTFHELVSEKRANTRNEILFLLYMGVKRTLSNDFSIFLVHPLAKAWIC